MQSAARTVEEYCAQVPQDQADGFHALRATILVNLPAGFEECINYGMLGYIVPKQRYPDGYHCDPILPLPFMALAYQKNSINLYHMGVYVKPGLHEWFVTERSKYSTRKLDMGKSCIRFKHYADIPHELLARLIQKISVDEWIELYEKNLKKK